VQGNLVGTDCRGLSPLPNGLPSSGGGGILVSGEGHTIGGTTAGQRNVISANDDDGVRLHAASGVVIQGNFIGTDRTGTRALGNALNGVFLADGSSNNTIGGTTPGERNWICANGQAGPRQAIGTPVNLNRSQEAMVGRPSGTNALGLSLQGGVTLAGEGTSNNVVQGNWIGLTVDGRSPLPNSPAGVMLYAGANQNLIGGLAPGEGNRIAFNSGGGILGVHDNTTGNSILGNAIYGNNGLGISLTPLEAIDLPTPNDNLDPDTGPNNLQNFPTITNVSYSSGATLVEGVLRSTPDQTFAIQIFHNTSPDPSGYGEGEVYAGLATVTADDQGIAGFSFLASGDLPARYFTATATDLDSGDTSEFSAVVRDIGVPPALSIHDTLVAEGSNGTATAVFTVSLSADSTQTVSVSYSTVNGAALAGSDYLATNGLLSFNPGEVSKTIEVIVTADPQPEPDEDFFVDLRNPANATLAEGTGRCLITELRITSIEVAETSLLISFTTSAGQPDLAYCLERASHLRPSADWTAVASGTGTGSIITLTNAGGGSLRTGYYRVLRQPVSDFRFPIADLRVARP
ncbi:MAG TPA: Calx-beta domain-containing protein, partial [Candidatus Binatia bacterium]|nr:Calx-beta domain-containing protein [Candidatus Binatia bacterium]